VLILGQCAVLGWVPLGEPGKEGIMPEIYIYAVSIAFRTS